MDKSKITVTTSYEGMKSFVQEQSNRAAKLIALNHIYEVFKDTVDTDLDARYNIIRLRKEVDLPIRMNTSDSGSYEFTPTPSAGSRKVRKHGGATQTKLQKEREHRMRYFGLDPDDKQQLVLYSEYLEAKKTLKKSQKIELTHAMRLGLIQSVGDLEVQLINIKN